MNIRQHKLELAADLRLYGLHEAVKRRLEYALTSADYTARLCAFDDILELIDLSEGGDDDGK